MNIVIGGVTELTTVVEAVEVVEKGRPYGDGLLAELGVSETSSRKQEHKAQDRWNLGNFRRNVVI